MKINLQNGTQIERSITSALVGYRVKSYELDFKDLADLRCLTNLKLQAILDFMHMKAIPNAN